MPTYSTPALVLKRTNYGEADRLVTLLTEKYGRVTAIARGVRKPLSKLRGFLELLTYGDFRLVEGKIFDTVVEVTPIDYFKQIREDLKRQTLAYGLAEMILVTLADREPHAGLLGWSVGWLRSIDHRPQTTDHRRQTGTVNRGPSTVDCQPWTVVYYTAMLTQYLSFVGHAPNLGECRTCHQPIQPEQLGWSHGAGGFVHVRCGYSLADIRKLESSIDKLIRFLASNNPEVIQKLQVEDSLIQKTADLMYDFFRYQIGRELRMLQAIVK